MGLMLLISCMSFWIFMAAQVFFRALEGREIRRGGRLPGQAQNKEASSLFQYFNLRCCTY
jgi:hypothetical protein